MSITTAASDSCRSHATVQRFGETDLIARQAALACRGPITHRNARTLILRGAEFRIAPGQFVVDEHESGSDSLTIGGGGEFCIPLPS